MTSPLRDVTSWNSGEFWRNSYDDLTDGLFFFAEDIFGGQFAFAADEIVSFEPETGEVRPMARDLESWAETLMERPEVLTGWPLAKRWRQMNGPLPTGRRLLPKTPFIAGGAYEIDNLVALADLDAMNYRGDVAVQIRDLPDGTQIRIDWQ